MVLEARTNRLEQSGVDVFLVPKAGFEPAHPCGR